MALLPGITEMTKDKRIVLNIIATYGRSLFSVACGLFTVRWVLMALGHTDFGLFGLVGSLSIFITFLNSQFSAALSRFYAFSIGRAQVAADNSSALDECRWWFTTGVVIHVAMPVAMVAIGYPIACYGITHSWLVIPPERIDACVWLWRFVCLSGLVSMVSVPFNAMYIARQYIAELTVYSFVQTAVRTAFIYVMTLVERDWLLIYGAAICLINSIPPILICIRAIRVFPECRLVRFSSAICPRMRELANYAWWQSFGGLGYICRHQLLEIIANRYFGPVANASYTVGAQVGAEAATFTGALNGAFTPAITSAYGAGDLKTFRAMAFRSSKFGALLTMVFAIPLSLEIDEILKIWLKNPPEFAKGFCLVWLIAIIIEKIYTGHIIAVNATGKVAKFQFIHALMCMIGPLVAIVLSHAYHNVCAIGIALIVSTLLSGSSDVVLARSRAGLSILHLVLKILIPGIMVASIGVMAGWLVMIAIPQSFHRVCITTLAVELAMLPSAWLFLLDSNERDYVASYIKTRLGKK